MIVINIKSGLGNQLFQYALGESLRLQGFHVKFHKGYNERSNRKFKLNVFHTFINELDKDERRQFYIYYNPKRIILQGKYSFFYKALRHIFSFYYRLIYNKKLVLNKLSDDYLKQISEYGDYLILDGYWANLRYFKHIRESLVNQFQLKKEYITPNYMHFKDLIDSSSKNSVSIHVRR